MCSYNKFKNYKNFNDDSNTASTDNSHITFGISPRRCFRRQLQEKIVFTNYENVTNNSINNKYGITNNKKFSKFINIFKIINTKCFIEKYIEYNLTFSKWKKFSKILFDTSEIKYKNFVTNLSKIHGIWELPTKEQLNVLCPLIKNLISLTNSKYITCIASGRALMEYHLAINKIPLICTSFNQELFESDIKEPFMKVENKNILNTTYSKISKIIYASWIHPLFENELLQVIHNNKFIDIIILSGQINGNCYSTNFKEKMIKEGFDIEILWTKGISKCDHPFVINNGPRSFTTIFYKSIVVSKKKIMDSFDSKYLWNYKIPNKRDIFKQALIDIIYINKSIPRSLLELKNKPDNHYDILLPIITNINNGNITSPPENFTYNHIFNVTNKFINNKKNKIIIIKNDIENMIDK
jgi:hypothetical protein